MIVLIHKYYKIGNKISITKPGFTRSCSSVPFYICNHEDSDNFKQVSLCIEIGHVTMFITQRTVKSLEVKPFPPSSPK